MLVKSGAFYYYAIIVCPMKKVVDIRAYNTYNVRQSGCAVSHSLWRG